MDETRVLLDEAMAEHVAVVEATVGRQALEIGAIIDQLVACFRGGGKLLLCGNGGSAADAQHIAAEFVNRLCFDRGALAAMALTTDTSVLTCVANDASYEHVFARQIEGLGKPGDVLAGLSTSGRSENVLAAFKAAEARGIATVGFTGRSGVPTMAALCGIVVGVASDDCARIQECHEFVWHFIAASVESEMFGLERGTGETL
jgi:D-sedoheptulose 7-phosphate isomerase